jgi:hypothetical protein
MGKHFVFCSVRIAIADVYSLEWHVDLSLVPQIYDAAPFLFNPHAQNLTAGSIESKFSLLKRGQKRNDI